MELFILCGFAFCIWRLFLGATFKACVSVYMKGAGTVHTTGKKEQASLEMTSDEMRDG